MPQDAFETVLMEGDIPQLHLACEQSASVGANERLQLLRDRLVVYSSRIPEKDVFVRDIKCRRGGRPPAAEDSGVLKELDF